MSWGNRAVVVDVTRDQVKHAPEYDPRHAPDRGFEVGQWTGRDDPHIGAGAELGQAVALPGR